jgi:hypothetical protein
MPTSAALATGTSGNAISMIDAIIRIMTTVAVIFVLSVFDICIFSLFSFKFFYEAKYVGSC